MTRNGQDHSGTLSIVIPALNEEQSIGSTIERCIAASPEIARRAGVADVEVIVVSDGSTDRTAEIAGRYREVRLVVFPENRGYGAAIKAGFEAARGDLLGFLDADGTCDPRFFGGLGEKIAEGYDIVLGSRMGGESRMPLLRRIGNALFAWLLGRLARTEVRDTASGMRLLRRTALPHLFPLPNGMHFTPAMSARALLDGHVRIAEAPMPYAEREGRSKLRVIRDGFRFLGIILATAAHVRPSRLAFPACAVLLAIMGWLSMGPLHHYARFHRVEEGMIYRLLLASLIATTVVAILCGTWIAEQVISLSRGAWHRRRAMRPWWMRTFPRLIGAFSVAAIGACGWLVGPGFVEFFLTGFVGVHWSRVVLAARKRSHTPSRRAPASNALSAHERSMFARARSAFRLTGPGSARSASNDARTISSCRRCSFPLARVAVCARGCKR